MRARLTAIVVGVNEIDPETFKALHALAGSLVSGERGADLSVVERNRGEKNARAVEVEVATINPEFAEPEAHGPANVEHLVRSIHERSLQVVFVLRRVDVPEFVGQPRLGERNAAL